MSGRHEIILAGSGGQGLVVSGRLLGEAAILEGKNVVQTQSYGIAQRGGLSSAELIIDPAEIIFQQVQKPDAVIALSEPAIFKYAPLSDTVPVFYDSGVLQAEGGKYLSGLPFARLAEKAGAGQAANMAAMGAMLSIVRVVSMEAFHEVIRRTFAAAVAEKNIAAVKAGAEALRAAWGKEGSVHHVWKV